MFHLLKAKTSDQIRNIIQEFEIEYSLFVEIFYNLKQREDILIQQLLRSYEGGPLIYFEAKKKRSIMSGWKENHQVDFLNPIQDIQSCKFSYWDDDTVINTHFVKDWNYLKKILDALV